MTFFDLGFWQVFAVFTVFSALCFGWPLLRSWQEQKRALRDGIVSDLRHAVQEDRLHELETTLQQGDIDSQELASLQQDLERTIALEDAQTADDFNHHAITFGSRSKVFLAALCLITPLLAFVLYTWLGAKPDWDIREQMISLNSQPQVSVEEQRALMASIQRRLEQTPENGHLLFLQGNIAVQLGDYEEAVRAYQSLNTLFPDSATVLAELAQALFLRAGNTMTPSVRENTQRALELDNSLPTALGLAGIDAFQSGEYEQAISLWQRAVQQLDPSAPAAVVLTQGIAQAQAALAATGKPAKPSGDEPSSALPVEVTLADTVEADLSGAVLFVYARAWQGSKMPLAIQRLDAPEFPVSLVLDKTMAMAQGMDISSAPQLEVVARVSLSGNAAPQSGDWQGSFGPVILDQLDGVVRLSVNEQIP